MNNAFKVLLVAAVGLALSVVFVYSGLFNVSAMVPHSAFAQWVLSSTMHASVERRARDIAVPELTDDALRLAGINDFEAMCAGCHGAPGKEREPTGVGLNPRPPDLRESARHLSDAEIFWVTKHGIRMTGMPAWGATHDDDALWPVVAFVRMLPELDASSYRALRARAAGAGHHASEAGAAHTHGSPADDAHPDAGHTAGGGPVAAETPPTTDAGSGDGVPDRHSPHEHSH